MEEISSALSLVISDYIKDKNLQLGVDIFFLMSSDANHYGTDFNNIPFGEDSLAHAKAVEQDNLIANDLLTGVVKPANIQRLTEELKKVVWCGKYSIPMGLLTTNKVVNTISGQSLSGKIFRYSDTFTEGVLPVKDTKLGTTAPFSLKHWCGFLSAGYLITP
jgi:predicted class III extradiol MEMO1 family dioxygenase